MLHLHELFIKGNVHTPMESTSVGAWGRPGAGIDCETGPRKFGGDGQILKLDCRDGRQLYIYFKSFNYSLKMCEFYGM